MAEGETPVQTAIIPRDSSLEELVKVESKRRLVLKEYRSIKSQLETMKRELAEYRSRPTDPTVEQLKAELLEIKHRKVFDKIAARANARGDALDDIWRLSGFKVDHTSDVISEEALQTLVNEQRKVRPYLFEQPGNGESTEPSKPGNEEPMAPGPGNSRGGLVRDAGKMQLRRKGPGSISDPEWFHANRKEVETAISTGKYEFVD
jgi:hypothetical protein